MYRKFIRSVDVNQANTNLIKDEATMIYINRFISPLGKLLAVSNGTHLVGLWGEYPQYPPEDLPEDHVVDDTQPVLFATKRWLDAYFAGKKPGIDLLPLAPQGTNFQKAVWEILCTIPYGQCTTYGTIAKQMADQLGKPKMSSQAVGGAVGHNPISIIIPCHRVIGSHGNLTGYGGGIDKKIMLLQLEGFETTTLFIPKTKKKLKKLLKPS